MVGFWTILQKVSLNVRAQKKPSMIAAASGLWKAQKQIFHLKRTERSFTVQSFLAVWNQGQIPPIRKVEDRHSSDGSRGFRR
jgi:hypothetical protein